MLIVGGGPAGAGVALTLTDAGVQALVVERATSLRDRPGECLTPNFRPLLERLRLTALLSEHGRIPEFVSRWDFGVPVERPLIADRQGEGWLLDRRHFEAQLIAEALRRGAKWQLGWSVAALARADDGWHVELIGAGDRRTVAADFVIDATGRAASLLRKLGVPRDTGDRLFGSWLVTAGRGRVAGPVLIEVGLDGWWYASSLPDGRTSIVCFSDRPAASAAELLNSARDRGSIAATLGDGPEPVLSIHAAGSARAQQVCGPGWFAVGDAALAFDPLSSYGLGSALGTGYYAAQALLAQWSGDADAPAVYQALLNERWSAYVSAVVERYDAAHPFHDEPFWRERRRRVHALRGTY